MYIKVRVIAGSKRESIAQKSADHFNVHVREEAERNMANKRVLELIALHYGVPAGKVRIINGHHSPGKILSVDITE